MNDQSASNEQGPAVVSLRRKPHDFTRFDRLMSELQEWRSDDHEDNKVLCRSHIIEIIEGVKALRGEIAPGMTVSLYKEPQPAAIEEKQKHVDYWGDRCCKADAEIARLRATLLHARDFIAGLRIGESNVKGSELLARIDTIARR